jgi:hypothetical protein
MTTISGAHQNAHLQMFVAQPTADCFLHVLHSDFGVPARPVAAPIDGDEDDDEFSEVSGRLRTSAVMACVHDLAEA